jgi:hypothetical protein
MSIKKVKIIKRYAINVALFQVRDELTNFNRWSLSGILFPCFFEQFFCGDDSFFF